MTLRASENIESGETALSARYPLADTMLHIGGRDWKITSVVDQDALVESVQTEHDLEQFPYGLMLWASAIGLAERLAETPDLVRGKRVLEIGAGVGLPGLVAQWLGAESVTQTDYQADALALARRNARRNGISGIHYRIADWRRFPPDLLPDTGASFDVVLGSDVLYERALHTPLADVLARLIPLGDRSRLLIVSDPLRPQAMSFLDAREREGGWHPAVLEGRRAQIPLGRKSQEIALFFVRRGNCDALAAS